MHQIEAYFYRLGELCGLVIVTILRWIPLGIGMLCKSHNKNEHQEEDDYKHWPVASSKQSPVESDICYAKHCSEKQYRCDYSIYRKTEAFEHWSKFDTKDFQQPLAN